MSFISQFFVRKNGSNIDNALSDHKLFSSNMSDKNKQNFDKSWNTVLQDFQNKYIQDLSKLSAKQRWDFAYILLSNFNEGLPFDLLEDIIPDIPLIHTRTLDSDIIEIMLEDIEIAKYEYGFTISELGRFSELLAKNSELSLKQTFAVIGHALEVGLSNYSYSSDEFIEFLACLDIALEKINIK